MASIARPPARGNAHSVSSKPPSAHVSDQAAAAIPAEIRGKKRWLVWRWWLPPGEEKWKKPPVDPLSGRHDTKWLDPRNWLTFEEAPNQPRTR